ncbi:MAG: YihY/virulence factor BrkB family protein [Clostridia bacterium]|nr:YihY/virulence factor BrkB family protein [Clostridia bacterium]
MKILWINTKKFFAHLDKHKISEYTAQCAYYTILSFIPFIILVVTLLKYAPMQKETLIEIIGNIMPENMTDVTIGIIQEVYSKSIETISMSAIFVLWSARRGFYALSKGLQNVYETHKEYNFLWLQIKSIILTIIFVIAIVSALLISVFGNSMLQFVQIKFNISSDIANIFHFSKAGMYFVLFIIFVLMYRFVPGHKMKIKKQIPGAIVATIGWYIISLIFSTYLENFKGFSLMYGSLTTIVLTMMWVYFSMYIILIGAEINNFKAKNLKYGMEITGST